MFHTMRLSKGFEKDSREFSGVVGEELHYRRLACIDSRSSMATGLPDVPCFASTAGVSAATSESSKVSRHLQGPHSV